MYIPQSLQEENVHNNCLMGLIFWTNWRVDLTKTKIPEGRTIFWKIGTKVSVLHKEFEGQFLGFHEKKIGGFLLEKWSDGQFLGFHEKF